MLKIEKKWENFVIEDILNIWQDNLEGYINLKKNRGKDIVTKYDNKNLKIVDYPGEYNFLEKNLSLFFIVNEDKNNKLNYIIKWLLPDKNVAFVQSIDFLQQTEDLPTIHIWLLEDESLHTKLESLEYEWDFIVLK